MANVSPTREDNYVSGWAAIAAVALGAVAILGGAYIYINETGPVTSGPILANVQQSQNQ